MERQQLCQALSKHKYELPVVTSIYLATHNDNKNEMCYGVRNNRQFFAAFYKPKQDDLFTTINNSKTSSSEQYALIKATKYEPVKYSQLRGKLMDCSVSSIHINSLDIPQYSLLPVFKLSLDIDTKSINIDCVYRPHWITYCTVINSEQDYGRFTTRMILHTKRMLKFIYDREQLIILKCTFDFLVDIKGQIYFLDAYDMEIKRDEHLIHKYLELLQNSIMIPNKSFANKSKESKESITPRESKPRNFKVMLRKSMVQNTERKTLIRSHASRGSSRVGEKTPNPNEAMKIKFIKIPSNADPLQQITNITVDNMKALPSNRRSQFNILQYIAQAREVNNTNSQMSSQNKYRSFKKYKMMKVPQFEEKKIDATSMQTEDSPLYVNKALSYRKIKNTVSYLNALSQVRSTLRNLTKIKSRRGRSVM